MHFNRKLKTQSKTLGKFNLNIDTTYDKKLAKRNPLVRLVIQDTNEEKKSDQA
jgi:hypothetical protein